MRVKLFTANTMQDAMAKAKHELGRDAVILHTRRFNKGGFLGFFSKELDSEKFSKKVTLSSDCMIS